MEEKRQGYQHAPIAKPSASATTTIKKPVASWVHLLAGAYVFSFTHVMIFIHLTLTI